MMKNLRVAFSMAIILVLVPNITYAHSKAAFHDAMRWPWGDQFGPTPSPIERSGRFLPVATSTAQSNLLVPLRSVGKKTSPSETAISRPSGDHVGNCISVASSSTVRGLPPFAGTA